MTYYGYFFIIGVTRPVILYLRDIRWFIANTSFPWRGGSQFFINIADNSFLDWFSPGAVGHVFEFWCWPLAKQYHPAKMNECHLTNSIFQGQAISFWGSSCFAIITIMT